MDRKPKILAVDDEEFNLDILTEYLTNDGYEVIGAEDGDIALQKLEEHPDIDVIVLDRMMPKLSGMDVLERIKADERFQDIPVVMQTAAASPEQILQGLHAGAYYYLTKPYGDTMLLGIVRAALRETTNKKELLNEVRTHQHVLKLMVQSSFHFRTLNEAKNLASFIASCFPDPERVVYGLGEIFINAVEHGHLGITYAEKTTLVLEDRWQQEIDARLALPENRSKYVHVDVLSDADNVTVTVKDQGKGFDWEQYLEFSSERATDPHGRGIATSRLMSFDAMEYHGCGNEVMCAVYVS